jgi:antitoxin component YwqK of YwqJK toxin-antitoxin module
MKRWMWVMAAVVAAMAGLACYRHAAQPTLRSNFAEIRITDGRILTASSGTPYTGTLITRDQEIAALVPLALGDKPMFGATPVKQVRPEAFGGLILVLPIANGQPSGRATLYADLRSPNLSAGIVARGDVRAALARAVAPAIAVAEATFQAGKLDGPAALFAPAPDRTGTYKSAEVQFQGGVVHGAAIEYFPGMSQPRRTLMFAHGTQSGPQRWFHANGAVARESVYLDGAADGEVKEYYADGARRARATYSHGTPVGTRQSWFPTGQRRSEITYDEAGDRITEWYSNGNVKRQSGPDGDRQFPPDGVIEEVYDNGALRSRTHYAGGVQHGAFEVFYATRQRWKAGTFEHGKQAGPYHEWWKNGRPALECTYVNGVRDGSLKRWYANGALWESAQLTAGKLSGAYRKWWKNGAPAHVYAYVNGKLDGDYRTFYDNGAKWAVGRYAGGKPQGTLQRWFPDGKLGYVMHHENGRPAGEHRRWYADGKPRLEATYVAGQLDGELRNWREDGSIYELATYRRGLKIKTTRSGAAP